MMSGLFAFLPLIVRVEVEAGPQVYGLLLTCMGTGAVCMGLGLLAGQWGAEYPKWDFHVDPDFESIRDRAPFRALVGPRG